MNDSDLYLSAEEASQVLNISVPTLYAYVSRKMIRSERVEGTRERKYWRADIDRLRGKAASAAEQPTAPLTSVSRITLITDGGLFFRGHDAIELAEHTSVEALAALLWGGDEETLFGRPPTPAPDVWPRLKPSFEKLGMSERVVALFPMIERANPRAYDLSPSGYARTGAEALRWFAALVAQSDKVPMQPLHQFLAKAFKAPAGFDDVIRRTLVLSADHEFDPINYAVRAVANVGVTPYQAITVGLIASQGQRFQAERYGATSRFLQELLAAKDATAVVVQRLRGGESLPGFSVLRSRPDPRTAAMMGALERVIGDDREFQRLQAAQLAARDVAGLTMDFIVPSLFVGHRLGLRGEELAVSALGRIVGWIAHSMEQFHEHELVRPRAAYAGKLPKAPSGG